GVHLLQARQTARGLLRLADAAEAQGDWAKTVDYLNRYLLFVPDDTQSLARFGLTLDKYAVIKPRLRGRALMVLEQVLRRDPQRSDIRRKVVEIAMSLNRFADARAHLDVLTAALPSDGELYHLLGACLAGEGKYADAVRPLEKAIQNPPRKVESYV